MIIVPEILMCFSASANDSAHAYAVGKPSQADPAVAQFDSKELTSDLAKVTEVCAWSVD